MVEKAESLRHAREILRDHAPRLDLITVSLDEENRVDIYGDISISRLSRGKTGYALPLVFGHVTGDFRAVDLGMDYLEGSPYKVDKEFIVTDNNLHTLTGGPTYVGGSYRVHRNPLRNLDGLASHIGYAVEFDYRKDLPLLRTLVAKKIWPTPDQPVLESILNKYAGQGKMAVFDCQKDLEDHGFDRNAIW